MSISFSAGVENISKLKRSIFTSKKKCKDFNLRQTFVPIFSTDYFNSFKKRKYETISLKL